MVLYVKRWYGDALVPNDYRRCLEQLTDKPPDRIGVIVRAILPGIEAAISAGQSLKDVWQALEAEGLKVSYNVFHVCVSRARSKPTAAQRCGKRDRPAASTETGRTDAHGVEERDPFANLKRLGENRSGFQWRGTQKLQRLVHGIEDSDEKGKR
jgi:hypothetical protein